MPSDFRVLAVNPLRLGLMCRDVGEAGYQCAGCGEWNETTVDVSAGSRQNYVEDCQVCCKPNVLDVRWSASDKAYLIRAELES